MGGRRPPAGTGTVQWRWVALCQGRASRALSPCPCCHQALFQPFRPSVSSHSTRRCHQAPGPQHWGVTSSPDQAQVQLVGRLCPAFAVHIGLHVLSPAHPQCGPVPKSRSSSRISVLERSKNWWRCGPGVESWSPRETGEGVGNRERRTRRSLPRPCVRPSGAAQGAGVAAGLGAPRTHRTQGLPGAGGGGRGRYRKQERSAYRTVNWGRPGSPRFLPPPPSSARGAREGRGEGPEGEGDPAGPPRATLQTGEVAVDSLYRLSAMSPRWILRRAASRTSRVADSLVAQSARRARAGDSSRVKPAMMSSL